jgi:hypothetical protein
MLIRRAFFGFGMLTLASLAASPPSAHAKAAAHQNLCQGADGYSRSQGAPRTFLWRPAWLALEKARVARDPAYAAPLREAADAALKRGPYSVMQKTRLPASGDKHDYMSIGPYWWPSPNTPNGEPYVRKDGVVNPESRGTAFDKDRMAKFSNDVRLLTLASHHLNDRRYAEHAAALVRAWFITPATRMNPNLNYGQAIPGVNTGRGEGIIELHALSSVVESIGLLHRANALSAEDVSALERWFAAMVDWMATSPIGQEERAKGNNHGIFYDYLLAHFALFARHEPVARTIIAAFPEHRLAPQLAANGSLPEELSRTRSWHYSYFALEAATKLATISECVGIDLWSAKTRDQKSLALAFAFLAPYEANLDAWPYKDSGLADPAKRAATMRQSIGPLRMMAWGSGDTAYERLAAQQTMAQDLSIDYWLPPLTDLSYKK